MATPMLQVPRFWVPLEAVIFNRFQAREEGSYDVEAFASAEIVPLAKQLPETKGLLTVPTGRLVTAEGYAASDLVVLVQKRLMSMGYPNLDTSAAMYRAAWAKSGLRVELAFGHRRKEAFAWLRDNHPDYAYGFLPVDVKFMDDETLLRYCVTENFARKNLSLMEEVHQIEMVKGHLEATRSKRVTLEEVGAFVGRSRSRVSNLLALKDASDGLRTAVAEKVITGAVAEELGKLERMIPHINLERWMQEPTPRQFLAEVIEGSRRVTRDQVREYVDKLGRSSRNSVPEAWLTTTLEGGEGTAVVSPKCGTCPAQGGGNCLNLPCWRLKRWLAGRKLAQEIAPSRPMVGMTGYEFDVTALAGVGPLLKRYLEAAEGEANQDPAILVGVPHGYGIALSVRTLQVEHVRPDETDPAKVLVYAYKGGVEALKEKMAALGVLAEPAPATDADTFPADPKPTAESSAWAEKAIQKAEGGGYVRPDQKAEAAWAGVDFEYFGTAAKEIVERMLDDVLSQLGSDLSKFLFRSGPAGLNWLDTFLRVQDVKAATRISINPQAEWQGELRRVLHWQLNAQLVRLGLGLDSGEWARIAAELQHLPPVRLTNYDKAVLVVAQAPKSRWATSLPAAEWTSWAEELLADELLPRAIAKDLAQVMGYWGMVAPSPSPAAGIDERQEEGEEALPEQPQAAPTLAQVGISKWLDAIEAGMEAEVEEMLAKLPAEEEVAEVNDLPVFKSPPAGLSTKLKLRRLGRKAAEGQMPVGQLEDERGTRYALYEIKKAIPLMSEVTQ